MYIYIYIYIYKCIYLYISTKRCLYLQKIISSLKKVHFLIVGIVLSINGIGTMVILSLGKIVIQKLGEAHTVIVGLLLYCVRFLFFYFIE